MDNPDAFPRPVGSGFPGSGEDGNGETLANARLIASAPDLYAALSDVLVALEASRGNGDYPDFKAWETAARAALAKANGETEA